MVVHATYSEIIDLNTKVGTMTVIGIHSPVGNVPQKKLAGLFFNFRKFKYLGCKFSMAPAAQLPVDPLGVGTEAGQATMDPRDLLNPILFHGAHGENINSALNVAYRSSGAVGDSVNFTPLSFGDAETSYLGSIAETNYYSALADPSWRKFSIMSSFSLSLHPLVHNVATITPIANTSNGGNVSPVSGGDAIVSGSDRPRESAIYGLQGTGLVGSSFGALPQQVLTNGVSPLGWMECVSKRPFGSYGDASQSLPRVNFVPRCYMGVLILPPAYSVQQAFRIVIHHDFLFDELTVNNQISVESGGVSDSYIDNLDESMKPEYEVTSLTTNGDASLVTDMIS